jgi:hypothetical protein
MYSTLGATDVTTKAATIWHYVISLILRRPWGFVQFIKKVSDTFEWDGSARKNIWGSSILYTKDDFVEEPDTDVSDMRGSCFIVTTMCGFGRTISTTLAEFDERVADGCSTGRSEK